MQSMLCRRRSITSYEPLLALGSVFGCAVDLSCYQRGVATQVAGGGPTRTFHPKGAQLRYARGNPRRSEAGNAEVHFNDLRQTLEAHRLKNRASLIRKVASEGNPAYYRPEINYAHLQLATEGNGSEARKDVLPDLETIRLQKEWRAKARLREENAVGLWRLRRRELVREYLGVNFPPLLQYTEIYGEQRMKENTVPWLKHLKWSGGDASSRLNVEIKAFEAYMSPTAAEGALREAVIREIQSLAAIALHGASLKIHGSYSTGLYTPNSDIDLRLTFPVTEKGLNERGPSPTRPAATRENLRQLNNFMRYLQATCDFADTRLIMARTPIGVTTHRATGFRLQISIMGEITTPDEYVKTYLAEYPALRPLYFIVKNILWIRDFTNTFTGGLGSYPLFMIIVAWLRLDKSQDITIWRHNNDALGRNLLDFLEFYASFDYHNQGLSIEPPRVLSKRLRDGRPSMADKEEMAREPTLRAQSKMCIANEIQPYRLYLQDPADPYNDLGSKCYGIKHIRAIFQHTLARLRQDMIQFEQNPALFERGGLLEPAIGGRFDWLEKRRVWDGVEE